MTGEPVLAEDPRVYDPREDSELLARVIERHGKVGLGCEVGCGSGYVTLRMARIARRVVATDINPHAVALTRENALRAGLDNIHVVRADLLAPLGCRFDLICANPPYLPVALEDDPLTQAWAGGTSGHELIARLLAMLPDHLAENGCAYMVVSTLSGLEEVAALAEKAGLSWSVVDREAFDFEELYVWRFVHAARIH